MNRGEAVRFVLLRSLGNFLVLFAIYGVVATFGPALYYEVRFRVIEARGVQFNVVSRTRNQGRVVSNAISQKEGTSDVPIVGKIPNLGFAEILAGNKEQLLIPIDTDFSILIPKIGASAKIYPNVDSTNPDEFLPLLAKGIAHAKGSVFPGMTGNVYLFAHSTDNWWHVGMYNAVFYLLKDLKAGDEIVVFFENRRYEYRVAYTAVTDPSDVGYLTASHAGESRLVLQTCWPPGTTWKRLYVIAVPVNP